MPSLGHESERTEGQVDVATDESRAGALDQRNARSAQLESPAEQVAAVLGRVIVCSGESKSVHRLASRTTASRTCQIHPSLDVEAVNP